MGPCISLKSTYDCLTPGYKEHFEETITNQSYITNKPDCA